ARATRGVGPRADPACADLCDRSARAHVVRANQKDDRVHEPERVLEHQALELSVVRPAPMRSGEERPPDLDFAPLGVEAEVARRADHTAIFRVSDEEGAAGFHRLAEEFSEDVRLPAVVRRVLLPDERVGGDSVERVEVIRAQRADFYETTF